MLSAILINPWIGGLVGLLTNTLQGIFYSPISLPFGMVNLSIGLVTGYMVIYLKGFHRWYSPLVVGLATGLLAPLIAAPIATYLFGGITAHGIDKIVVALVDGGNSILSSAFWGRLPYSLADKLISACTIFVLIKWLAIARTQRGESCDQ